MTYGNNSTEKLPLAAGFITTGATGSLAVFSFEVLPLVSGIDGKPGSSGAGGLGISVAPSTARSAGGCSGGLSASGAVGSGISFVFAKPGGSVGWRGAFTLKKVVITGPGSGNFTGPLIGCAGTGTSDGGVIAMLPLVVCLLMVPGGTGGGTFQSEKSLLTWAKAYSAPENSVTNTKTMINFFINL